jgi:hypothetical protein
MKILIFVAVLVFAISAPASAETFAIHISKGDTRKISRESMVVGKLQWKEEDEGESIVVSVYSPGKRVGELKSEELDLQKLYETARDSEEVGPFFGPVDEYVVGDEEGRWFLIHYEYKRPGAESHTGRFRLGRLERIVEGADLFFLVDYMQDCSAEALTNKMAELGESKLIFDRRGQYYRMLLRAAEAEEKRRENMRRRWRRRGSRLINLGVYTGAAIP